MSAVSLQNVRLSLNHHSNLYLCNAYQKLLEGSESILFEVSEIIDEVRLFPDDFRRMFLLGTNVC